MLRPVCVLVGGLLFAVPRVATADACDAGASCADDDGDGFAACGCPWSGTPCDCDDHDPATYPGAPEACDAKKDFNCSGVVPDACPRKHGCLGSVCVVACIPLDDFGCPPESHLFGSPCLCAPIDCSVFGCPPGLACNDAKTCVATCTADVRCPAGQICRGFGCVDPCSEVTCPSGSACQRGRCLPSCACASGSSGCPPGEACDQTAAVPTCVDSACVGVRCTAGSHCERGVCVDDCKGVICPQNRVCRQVSVNGGPSRGTCVDLCSPSPCKPGFVCQWRTGECTPRPIGEGGLEAPPELSDPLEVAGAGWLCSASGVARASAITAAASIGAIAAFAIRRRRRRRR